ncbi:MAG TPA: hypothetical protein VIM12_00830 [Noviherbaspirillum sp.]|jgi:hypothetical protein|uniref:hypothetical protein n=1 Tax=Noviherbaspirillum sp. TaxID=1926288 RepID=UPI002F950A38
MATQTTHHGIRIFTLEEGERILDHCGNNDIAIVQDEDGWWTYFVGEDGEVEGYDEPFDSLRRAQGAARAAAEIMAE